MESRRPICSQHRELVALLRSFQHSEKLRRNALNRVAQPGKNKDLSVLNEEIRMRNLRLMELSFYGRKDCPACEMITNYQRSPAPYNWNILAQCLPSSMGEYLFRKQEVLGSSPGVGSKFYEWTRVEIKPTDYYEVGGQTIFPTYGGSGGLQSSSAARFHVHRKWKP